MSQVAIKFRVTSFSRTFDAAGNATQESVQLVAVESASPQSQAFSMPGPSNGGNLSLTLTGDQLGAVTDGVFEMTLKRVAPAT